MTGAPRGPWRWSSGPAVLLGTAGAIAFVLLAPPASRALLWLFSLTVVSVFAGLLLGRIERRTHALQDAYRGTLDIMSRLIDSVERYSENHSRRVAESSVDVARALGCSEAEVEDIRVAGLLHDLGKLDVPAEALAGAAGLLPEALDDFGPRFRGGKGAERDAQGGLRSVIFLVVCCQDRWDGTGRRGLRGAEIPIGARILAVADAYDAIVTDRAHQKGRTPAEAIEALQSASGTQFDPHVVEAFIRLRAAQAGGALPQAA